MNCESLKLFNCLPVIRLLVIGLLIFSPSVKSSTGDEELMVVVAEDQFERRVGRYDDEDLGRNNNIERSGNRQSLPTELVTDIHCIRTSSRETFTAFLRLPDSFVAAPVLEELPTLDSNVCLIAPTNVDGVFALDLSRMEECGVRSCVEDNEQWMCVMVRFPHIEGIKMPEDEVIDIKCKPQDRAIEGQNKINFQKNAVEQRSPIVFFGGGQEFLSEIGLFRKLPGTELYASRVKSGSTIELGENVQLRSIVRAGDGWRFAKITDVVVHRVHDGKAMTGAKDTAQLVYSDGCRNPTYKTLAPSNPWRDAGNGLINNFDFRVFMFQEMINGDAIMISAKVMACVEEIDCAPVRCNGDTDYGYGRRRRSIGDNGTEDAGKTQNWEENLELKIRMPVDLSPDSDGIQISKDECKLYLIITLAVALTFCVLSAMIVLIACIKRYQEVRNLLRKKKEQEELASKAQEESGDAKSKSDSSKNGRAIAYYPYFIPSGYDPRQFHSLNGSNGSANGGAHSQRPVTVRSVKRRDREKSENRQQMEQRSQSTPNTPRMAREERAVMV